MSGLAAALVVAVAALVVVVVLVAVEQVRYRRLLDEVEARLEAIDAGPETP